MSLTPCSSSKLENARIVQTIKNKFLNGLFLLATDPDWKKQVRRRTLSRAKQNGDQALEPTLTKNGKAAMKMMMMPHLKPFGGRVPTQLKDLQTCPSRQRLKILLEARIKCIGVKRFVLSWTR